MADLPALTDEELERYRRAAQAAVESLETLSREAADGLEHPPATLAEEWEWQVVSEICVSREETFEPLRGYVEEVRPDLVLRLLSDLAAARAEVERLSKLVSPMRALSGFRGPWKNGAKSCRYCGNVIWRMSEGQVGEHDEKCPTMIARKALCDTGISSPANILRGAVSDDAARALVASPGSGAGEGRGGE